MGRVIYVVKDNADNAELLEKIDGEESTDEELVAEMDRMGIPTYKEADVTKEQIGAFYNDTEYGAVLFWDGTVLEG